MMPVAIPKARPVVWGCVDHDRSRRRAVLYGTLSPVPAPLHNFFFVSCLARKMFTLRNYELWTNVERTDLPAYLKRKCPLGSLREGRRLKTKLRLGCHPLRSSAARMSLTRNAACPCCGHGSETIVHTVFECHGPKLDDVRASEEMIFPRN